MKKKEMLNNLILYIGRIFVGVGAGKYLVSITNGYTLLFTIFVIYWALFPVFNSLINTWKSLMEGE